MEWYHVVMLSGGQLRHYEQYAETYYQAYEMACGKDKEDYPSNHTYRPDATVIIKDGGTFINIYHGV